VVCQSVRLMLRSAKIAEGLEVVFEMTFVAPRHISVLLDGVATPGRQENLGETLPIVKDRNFRSHSMRPTPNYFVLLFSESYMFSLSYLISH